MASRRVEEAAANVPARRRLAVVVPTFNRARTVLRTVQQVLATGVPVYEITVVDDGGTDDTAEVLSNIWRVRTLRQDNAGPAKARNLGAATTDADVVCFLDSDDRWSDDSMERLLLQLEATPEVDAVFADTAMGNDVDGFVSFIETYGGDAFRQLPAKILPGGLTLPERDPFFRLLSRRNVMFLGSLLVRRDVFLRVGGFNESLRGAADWEFFMRLILEATVAYSPGPPPSQYIKHDEGMSTDSEHMDSDFIAALQSVLAKPSLPRTLVPHIRQQLRRHLFGFAYQAYDRGDLPTARRRFLSAARTHGPVGRNLAYAALSSCPPAFVAAMRSVRRRIHA